MADVFMKNIKSVVTVMVTLIQSSTCTDWKCDNVET